MTVEHGDCLEVLRAVPEESFDLAYIDPPFLTQKSHKLTTRSGDREFSFKDTWSSQTEYARFLLARLREIHRTLSPSGSIYFHCDRRATHIARALLEETFGSQNFRSEIIWHYRRWSNSQRGFLPSHQTLLYYTKTDDYVFNAQFSEYSPSTNVDQILQKRERSKSGKTVYARASDGRELSNGPKKGVPLGDVWDIPYLNPKAKERVGYPTQKPILLLERIIQISTNEEARVLDPFCGSGTTMVAAHLLGRDYFGIDCSADAVELTRSRLNSPHRTNSALLQKGRESYRTVDKEALSLIAGLDFVPVQRNKGIDAILREQFQGRPVLVRVQKENESVGEAATALARAGKKKHSLKMFLVVTCRSAVPDLIAVIPPEIELIDAPGEGIRLALRSNEARTSMASEASSVRGAPPS
jgi:site-specific DNA-methyltransferase (adenine-specific)